MGVFTKKRKKTVGEFFRDAKKGDFSTEKREFDPEQTIRTIEQTITTATKVGIIFNRGRHLINEVSNTANHSAKRKEKEDELKNT